MILNWYKVFNNAMMKTKFCLLVLLILISLLVFSSSSVHSKKQSFISLWGGKSSKSLDGNGFDPTKVTQVSWSPRAFIYKGFLSHKECDHLIKLGKPKLKKSMVVDEETGGSVPSEVRTSSGSFLEPHQDEIVSRIERRIAAWTFLPEENGEAIQILHYEKGQKYGEHHDYLTDKYNLAFGGHRMATALMYLSDVKKGGETVFPDAVGKNLQVKDDSWSDCAKNGYAVKPRKGDALLFFSCHPNATTDPYSLHASCPVIEGEKWSATKWIHIRKFQDERETPDECVDSNANCAQWAAQGKCDKNNFYMVGTNETLGFCRKSCNACEVKEKERSKECVDENENCSIWAEEGECQKNAEYMIGRVGRLGFCRKSCEACVSLGSRVS